jgi:hypothetical protein
MTKSKITESEVQFGNEEMKASTLIELLQNIIEFHGDLPITGGYLHDDTPLQDVKVLNAGGCDVNDPPTTNGDDPKGTQIFLSM